MSPSPLRPGVAGVTAAALLGLAACSSADASTADLAKRSRPPGPSASQPADKPGPGADGIGDTVHPDLGNGGYDVLHWALRMRFAEDVTSYTASTTVNGRATQPLSRFNLDLRGTEVRDVTVDGRAARWSRSGHELRVTPEKPLPRGAKFAVRVRVRASVPDQKQAKKLGTQAVGIVRQGTTVQTLNQPAGARRIAAFADHPAQKAPATITIAAPSKLNSIANGEPTETRRAGAYTVRSFESRESLAPELLQIGVGRFTVVEREGLDGVKLRHALPTGEVNAVQPQLDASVPGAIRFLTERLGPFPLRTYGVYATPMGGSLETQSLTILSSEELTAEAFEKNGGDVVVAHEIAHEYFGNSVSPRRWSDLWLNEGHATYYEALWAEQQYGSDLEERMRDAYGQANAALRRYGPVAAPSADAFEPRDMAPYGPVAYETGALALYALRQEVGDALFERIERAWVDEHRDGTAGTTDFIRLAGRVAGRDLGPFLRSWLYAEQVPAMPGHPDWRA